MNNAKYTRIKTADIFKDPAFQAGLRDARAGLPFRAEYETYSSRSQMRYENGRYAGLLFKGKRVTINGIRAVVVANRDTFVMERSKS